MESYLSRFPKLNESLDDNRESQHGFDFSYIAGLLICGEFYLNNKLSFSDQFCVFYNYIELFELINNIKVDRHNFCVLIKSSLNPFDT